MKYVPQMDTSDAWQNVSVGTTFLSLLQITFYWFEIRL